MKKKLFTKSISVFLSVLMLMSCWVFAPIEADAIMDNSSKKADKYGTSYWTANDNNTRWMRWGTAADSSNDHLYIKVPKTIYLDVSETLQSAGYVITYSWHFGDSTDYRMGISSPVWGENSSYTGQNSTYFYTMTNAFTGFTADASMHGSNAYGVNGYSNANQYDIRVFDSYNGYKSIGLKNLKGTLYSGTIYYVGTPKGTYSGRYSTYGSNPSYFGYGQKWSVTKWNEHSSYTNMMKGKPTAASEQHSGYNEVFWDVEIYNKAPLKTAADNADTAYTNNYSLYNTYVLNDGLTALKKLADEGRAMLTVREQTNATISAKATAIDSARTGLQFQAKNAELISKVTEAKALQNKAGYKTLYTEASRNALDSAVNAATNSTLYTNTPIYSLGSYSNAGALAAADQASIATLISNINTAMSDLERRYDVGYDNLFSFTDWAASNAINVSRGSATVDVDKGTITTTSWDEATGTAWINAGADRTVGQAQDCYTSYGFSSAYSTMKVKGNTSYTLKFNATDNGQCYVFFYTDSGSASTAHQSLGASSGANVKTFTTPADCTGIQVRFGSTGAYSKTITFSNIGIYETSVYNDYAKNYTTLREIFSVGDTKNLSLTPVREGYVFDGWYKADGTKVTSVSGLTASDIVYAHWSQNFTVTFKNWNGEVLKTESVAPGAAATAPLNPTKAATKETEYAFDRWDKDFSNVQSDLVVTATYTTKDHNIVKSKKTSATCEKSGTYIPLCENECGVVWNDPVEDKDAPALGHTFERANPSWTVLADGATTETTHTVKCNAKDCTATTTKNHEFETDATKPAKAATCTTAGERYEKCDCGQTRTVDVAIDPENHVEVKLEGKVEAKCGVPGYTGDMVCQDPACRKVTETGSATKALDHIFTDYVDQNNATCDKEGTKVATCDREGCNATDTQFTGVKREHSFTNYIDQNDATCDAEGNEVATCDYADCNATDSRSTGKKREHSFTNYVDQNDATCDKEGKEIATCDYADCDATDTRSTGKKREHKFEIAVSNNDGTHKFECSYDDCDVCSDAVNCVYGAWTTDNATTHSHTCTICGYTPAAEAHDWSWQPDGAGKQTRTCTVCRKTETTDCNYVEDSRVDVTCEVNGTVTYKCTDCGHGYTEIVERAPGHNFSGAYVSDNNGKHVQKCVNFDCTATGNEAPCSDWTYTNTEAGKHTATCNVCDYTKTEDCSGGEATCTALAVCAKCNKAYGEKAPHNITGTEKYLKKATDATCIANETYYKYCINCENEFSTETYEKPDTMTAHDYTCTDEYLYIATQAKCGVNETYYAYCSNADCKKSSEDANNTYEKADTALTHKFDSNIVCNNDGTHTYECSQSNTDGWACTETADYNCADTAKLEGVVDAGCLTAGYNIYKCFLCDYEWTVETGAALGHDYAKQGAVKEAANCEHGTIYWYNCKWCDAKGADETDTEKYPVLFFEDTDKRAHSFQNKVDEKYLADPATCFAAAKYYKSCEYEDCGKSSEVVYGEGKGVKFSSGTPLEHKFDKKVENYLATSADCVKNATYYYVCSLCDTKGTTTWEKEDSKTGHSMEHKEAVAATCDAAGNYEYWYCSVCNKYFKDAEGNEAYANQAATVIAERKHDIVKVAYVAATCEIDGVPAYEYCAYEDCNYTTRPAVIPDGYKAAGHYFAGAYYYDSVNNYHAKYCVNANCDKVTLIDAEGKEYKVNSFGMLVDGKQVKYTVEYDGLDYVINGGIPCEFTYTESTVDGVHSHANKCVCGNANTKVYSDEETFVETIAPTCTAKGYSTYACPECGATWKKNEVESLGHTAAKKATPNGDGTHSIRCTVEGCNYAISTANCSGGTATCSALAVCTECFGEYGSTGDHVFETEWIYNEGSAKCEVNGTESNYCTACKKTITREAEGTALEHEMSDFVYALPDGVTVAGFDPAALKEPTCRENGYAVSYCTLCFNKYITKTVRNDANAHVWETDENGELVWEDGSGNCATGITKINSCTVCSATQTQTVKGEHSWVVSARVEANCEIDSYIVFKCSACSFTLIYDKDYDGEVIRDADGNPYELTEKLGHTWEREGSTDTLIVDKESTCAIAGRGHYVCGDCQDKSDSVEIEKLAHTLINVDEQKATCTVDGYGAYEKCIACAYDQHLDAEWLKEEGNYTKATGHADNNNDGKCDGCKKQMVGDATDNCDCICHKDNWFSKIIYKILHFFWKLFKIGKSCDCGTIHY